MPSTSKGSDSSLLAIKDSLGMSQKRASLYSDNSKELVAKARKANVISNTATPYRAQSDGKDERAVGLCIEGGRTVSTSPAWHMLFGVSQCVIVA